MNDSLVMLVAAVAAGFMAAAGALSMGRLATIGVCVMFIAAVWKYFTGRKKRAEERRSGDDRRHAEEESRRVAV